MRLKFIWFKTYDKGLEKYTREDHATRFYEWIVIYLVGRKCYLSWVFAVKVDGSDVILGTPECFNISLRIYIYIYIYKSLTSKVLCYSEFHAMCDLQTTKDYSVQLSCIWHPRDKNRCHFVLVRQKNDTYFYPWDAI